MKIYLYYWIFFNGKDGFSWALMFYVQSAIQFAY